MYDIFTFHNVSINTRKKDMMIIQYLDLHSTMFLLIRAAGGFGSLAASNLHSTMFLLIQGYRMRRNIHTDAIYIPQCFY